MACGNLRIISPTLAKLYMAPVTTTKIERTLIISQT